LNRVVALVHDRGAASLPALLTRAGLPESTFPAFRAALEARDEIGFVGTVDGATRLRRRMVERVLTMCETAPTEVSEPLLILLRRFATESAREEARVFCDELVAERAAEPTFEEAPVCEPEISEPEWYEPDFREEYCQPVSDRPRFFDRFRFKARLADREPDEAVFDDAESCEAGPYEMEPCEAEPYEAEPCEAELYEMEPCAGMPCEPGRVEPRFDELAPCESASWEPRFEEPVMSPRARSEPLLSDLLAAA
jgi:hypothetical protein